MPKTFRFTHFDVGNSPIVPDLEGSPTFTVTNERNFKDKPKLTTIISSEENDVVGSIDWKTKQIGVKGTTKPKSIVLVSGKSFSLTREWKWSTTTYIITFKNGAYSAYSSRMLIATYTPVKVRRTKVDFASFNFVADVTDEEMIFLMLALLYSDLLIPPTNPSFGDAAGEATGRAMTKMAVHGALNAAISCVIL